MKFNTRICVMLSAISLALGACAAKPQADDAAKSTQNPDQNMETTENKADTANVSVRVETTMGSFTVELFGDTPKHRDNFLKLVREGYYDGVLFHRVINEFMVQTGDPESRNAPAGKQLGAGGPGYTIDAEIVYPKYFHRRGALAAARQGDQVNPERRSSGSQFYIVTGKKVSAAEMQQIEAYASQQQMQSVFQSLAAKNSDKIRSLQMAGDRDGLEALRQELIKQTEAECAANPVTITPEMRKAYMEEGGSPHLDGQYTVFGQVTEGMDVIDRIEKAQTDRSDRPLEDIRIVKMEVLP